MQYDIIKETAKISTLWSVKIDKYEYLIGKEILLLDQSRIIEQAKFTFSLSKKASEKQTKLTEELGEKQTKAIENRVKNNF